MKFRSRRKKQLETSCKGMFDFPVNDDGYYEVRDTEAQARGKTFPDGVAFLVRDWVHETPLSRDSFSIDECADWPVVDEVIGVVVRALEARGYEITQQGDREAVAERRREAAARSAGMFDFPVNDDDEDLDGLLDS